MNDRLTHINEAGEAHMVDVADKAQTRRVAIAEGRIHMQTQTLQRLMEGNVKKGDVLGAARLAGIMAAKRTWELVPLCHPIALTRAEVTLTPEPERDSVHCNARTETVERTGVEMEALTAVQVALLTVYDMCKALDRGMSIDGVTLVHKSGGRSGTWDRTGTPAE